MAGKGKRMRPSTLTTPKPLFPIADKSIVEWLVYEVFKSTKQKIEEVAYIIHPDFGKDVETNLLNIASKYNSKGAIYYQEEALGTGHAILCAAASLQGNILIAFADTLFKADFNIDTQKDGIIWTKKVEDPRQYGVVTTDKNKKILAFVEKPETFVSDEAIIGIYFFKDGENLRKELQYLVDNNLKEKGEYQLTNAMESIKNKGKQLYSENVVEWLDCGNKETALYSHQRVLLSNSFTIPKNNIKNSTIIEPCYIGNNVVIENSIIGPYVSIGNNGKVQNSIIANSIVMSDASIEKSNIQNSIIGSHSSVKQTPITLNISDYSQIQ